MRDPAEITTTKGTPLILLVSRLAFLVYFTFFVLALGFNWFPDSLLNPYWFVYMLILYYLCERIRYAFLKKDIDLTFAFPILFAVFILNFVSLLVRGQEQIPIMNRAEHFTSFILLGYIGWVFFLKYLPQDVWKKHPYYTALLTLSVISLIGVLNEIVELFLDQGFGTRTVGSGLDTSLDLLMNTLGAGLFLAVQLILHEARESKKIH